MNIFNCTHFATDEKSLVWWFVLQYDSINYDSNSDSYLIFTTIASADGNMWTLEGDGALQCSPHIFNIL